MEMIVVVGHTFPTGNLVLGDACVRHWLKAWILHDSGTHVFMKDQRSTNVRQDVLTTDGAVDGEISPPIKIISTGAGESQHHSPKTKLTTAVKDSKITLFFHPGSIPHAVPSEHEHSGRCCPISEHRYPSRSIRYRLAGSAASLAIAPVVNTPPSKLTTWSAIEIF